VPCYNPLIGYWAKDTTPSGKRGVVFSKGQARDKGEELSIPCGKCIGCRLEYSRQWAIRCIHEASLYKDNMFLTLTYDEEHLPEDWSLKKEDFQKFMKRLRKSEPHKKIRFFHCGEYGDINKRPHYHAIIFNHDFDDKILISESDGANQKSRLFNSEKLTKLWTHGITSIGDVTYDSAAYVARYIVKKVNGDGQKDHYTRVIESTGQVVEVVPEYITMSRGGVNDEEDKGLGYKAYLKYKHQWFYNGYLVVNGVKQAIPKYYENLYKEDHPEKFEDYKAKKIEHLRIRENESMFRNRTKETVKKAQTKNLTRKI
jgi:hypothetical protein